ncbi:Uncharacterised protein [Vibrio cholerae]|nr:Uncharacterised protein [Vibrio cholerae]
MAEMSLACPILLMISGTLSITSTCRRMTSRTASTTTPTGSRSFSERDIFTTKTR